MILLVLVVVLLWSAVLARARVRAASGEVPPRRRPGLDRRLRVMPARDPADQPPPGLTTLVDSPRVVAVECARGIRELEEWLAEQAAA